MESPKISLNQLCLALDRTLSNRRNNVGKKEPARKPAVRRVVGGLDDIYADPAPAPRVARPVKRAQAEIPADPDKPAKPTQLSNEEWSLISMYGTMLDSEKGARAPPSAVVTLTTTRADRLKMKIALDKGANILKSKGGILAQVPQSDLRCIVAFGKGWFDNLVADAETLLPYLLSELLPVEERFWETP